MRHTSTSQLHSASSSNRIKRSDLKPQGVVKSRHSEEVTEFGHSPFHHESSIVYGRIGYFILLLYILQPGSSEPWGSSTYLQQRTFHATHGSQQQGRFHIHRNSLIFSLRQLLPLYVFIAISRQERTQRTSHRWISGCTTAPRSQGSLWNNRQMENPTSTYQTSYMDSFSVGSHVWGSCEW